MPNLDGRGPLSYGPTTGRGLGHCGGSRQGFGRRGLGCLSGGADFRGRGRRCSSFSGRGRGRNVVERGVVTRLELQEESDFLRMRLDEIEKELKERLGTDDNKGEDK